jgi:hypothetical protein
MLVNGNYSASEINPGTVGWSTHQVYPAHGPKYKIQGLAGDLSSLFLGL